MAHIWKPELHPRGPGGLFVEKGSAAADAWARRISNGIGDRRGEYRFDRKKARKYGANKSFVKHAELIHDSAKYTAEWGEQQDMQGKHFRVFDPATGATKYAVRYKEMVDNNQPVPGTKDGWLKVGHVEAIRHVGAPAKIPTVMSGDGHVETTNTANDGDWIVRQPDGELTVTSDAEFRKRYDVPPTPLEHVENTLRDNTYHYTNASARRSLQRARDRLRAGHAPADVADMLAAHATQLNSGLDNEVSKIQYDKQTLRDRVKHGKKLLRDTARAIRRG